MGQRDFWYDDMRGPHIMVRVAHFSYGNGPFARSACCCALVWSGRPAEQAPDLLAWAVIALLLRDPSELFRCLIRYFI